MISLSFLFDNESSCVFAGIGGSVEDMKPEMVEDKVETNDDIKNEEEESSKRLSGEK